MPLDANIILQGRAPQIDNPLEVQQKAQTLSNLGQQAQLQKQQIDLGQIQQAKQLAWSISDEPSYQAARQRGIELGLPNADKLPPTFDPNFVKQMQYNTLTAEERFARSDKDRDFQLREQELQSRSDDRRAMLQEQRYQHGIQRQDRADARADKLDEKMQGLKTPYGLANTIDDAKQLKEAHEAKANFDNKIEQMIKLREKHGGGAIMNREDVQRGKQLSKDLLLEYKNMAKLGVLSKSDEDIINAIIPEDPLQYNSPIAALQGQDPTLSRLRSFKSDSDKDFQNRVATRTRAGVGSAATGGGGVDLNALLEEKRRRSQAAQK